MVDESGRLEPVARDPGPVLPRWLLGIELKRLRETAGLSVAVAAKEMRLNPYSINRHESGASGIKPADFDALMELYGVAGGDRERLTELHRLGKQPGWWAQYGEMPLASTQVMLGMEAAAIRIRAYDDGAIPGLLQTDDYAHQVMEATAPYAGLDLVEQGIEIRRGRQATVFGDDATEVIFLISELALRRPVRDREVMRAQLRRLVEDVPPTAVVQIVPFAAGPHPSLGTYAICDFATEVIPHGVYAESLPAFNSTYWQEPDLITRFDRAWERTRALALSEEESAQMITESMKEYE